MRKVYGGGDEQPLNGELVLLGHDGILDSVAALQLVLSVEKEFKIVVDDGEIVPDNLKTIDGLTEFVRKKLIQK